MKDWIQIVIFSGNSLSDNKLYLLKNAESGECNVTTNIKAAMAKNYVRNACDFLHTEHLVVSTLAPSALPRPLCTKLESMYCDTCNRSFLSDKFYQNHLTVWVWAGWSVSEDKCAEIPDSLGLQTLSLNFSRYSAIFVTISSHQFVFATWFRSNLFSFDTVLCTFCLIRNARKIVNSVMDISKLYPT